MGIYSISSDETYAYMLFAYYNAPVYRIASCYKTVFLGPFQNTTGQGSRRLYVPIRTHNRQATENPRPARLSE